MKKLNNQVEIFTNCETTIRITDTMSGLYATFYNTNDDDPTELIQFWEIGAENLGTLMKKITDYANENDIDLF